MFEGRDRRLKLLLLVPLLYVTVLFVYPTLKLLFTSVTPSGGFSLAEYEKLFGSTANLRILAETFLIAAVVTVVCILLAYPLAYLMCTARPMIRTLLVTTVLMPFFASILVRTYAWLAILGDNGVLNEVLGSVGGRSSLIYTRASVMIGMVYSLLPYMVLAIYGSMRMIDRQLVHAAQVFGASRWYSFRTVFLPLSIPGVVGGTLLVGILGIGYFITPSLLGGPSSNMIGPMIGRQVLVLNDYPFASALSVVLLLATLIGFFVYSRAVGLQTLFGRSDHG